jgi:hypothetical protein
LPVPGHGSQIFKRIAGFRKSPKIMRNIPDIECEKEDKNKIFQNSMIDFLSRLRHEITELIEAFFYVQSAIGFLIKTCNLGQAWLFIYLVSGKRSGHQIRKILLEQNEIVFLKKR